MGHVVRNEGPQIKQIDREWAGIVFVGPVVDISVSGPSRALVSVGQVSGHSRLADLTHVCSGDFPETPASL